MFCRVTIYRWLYAFLISVFVVSSVFSMVDYISYLGDKSNENIVRKSKYEEQISLWVEAINSGNYSSNNDIAVNVFNKLQPRKTLRNVRKYL